MITVETTVTKRGPLLDGSAAGIIDAGSQEITDDVAEAALNLVHSRLGQVLRHPTGHYKSRVVTDRASGSDASLVTDQGVVYGPWLEGIGGRNKASRFKGYRTFRLAAEQVRREASKHARPAAAQLVKKLGG